MSSEVEKIQVLRFTPEGKSSLEESIVREFPVTIIMNNQELVTLLCTPKELDYLAVGHLASEGLINSKSEVKKITVDEQRGVVRVDTEGGREIAQDVLFKRMITSGCGRGASFYNATDTASQKVKSDVKISTNNIYALVNEFQHGSEVYLTTHGVHSAALADGKKILVFSEDIGRHNAIDKILGRCLLEDIPVDDKMLISSGRITSEIVHKAAKRGIPIVVSVSVPTDMGIKLANDLAITLIGAVRGNRRMTVYANDWRVIGS
ncbi:MAG: formate dehydrogenase accessory sulfurtransferase FdhD [Chloroflexota bacterium]